MASNGPDTTTGQPALAALLRAWRRRALLTQQQLAKRARLGVRTIRRLESSELRHPHGETVRLLAAALGLSDEERELLTAVAREEPAPRPAAAPVPCQLPADVAGFSGRAEQLRQLDALLAGDGAGTAVVISAIAGTAGVGKTALAVHFAHHARDRFPDGQLYVDLRGYAPTPPLRPIQALAQFLRALGADPDTIPVDQDEAAGLYRSMLASRRMLVVLDNAATAKQVRPLLPGSPGCPVLVTSRGRLSGLVARDGARRLDLDVLTADEANDLLTLVLGGRVGAEALAAAELAEACAYLPLALRLAAANLTDRPQQSIAAYVGELRAGDRLSGLAVDGDEQESVRAAFDLSYERLDGQARRLFRLLGLVPGPEFSADAAAALAGVAPAHAARLLGQLAGAHLVVERAADRFGFHDLLRDYAAERARRDDRDHDRAAAIRRLLGWYLHTVDAAARLLYPAMVRLPLPDAGSRPPPAFDDDTHALAWLEAERPNLLAAVQHAAEHGPRPLAWLLADCLRGYLYLRRYPVDLLAVAEAALTAAEADGSLQGQAAAQLALAEAHADQSRHELAIEHYARAVALARTGGWPAGQGAALGNLGTAYRQLGKLEQAAEHIAEALALFRRMRATASEATGLSVLGVIHHELGQLAAAVDYYTQALAMDRGLGSRGDEARDLGNLGEAYHALGRYDQALEHLTLALSYFRQLGNRLCEAETLRVLAEVQRDTGHDDQALELARAASALAGDLGDRRYEADALNTLATVHARRGDHRTAADHHQRALHLARATRTRSPEVLALIGLAAVCLHLGEPDRASRCAHQALTLARQAGYRLLEGQAHAALARVQHHLGQADQAIGSARQALTIHRASGHRLGQAHTLVLLGHALHDSGDATGATAAWRQALALFTEIGAPEAERIRPLLDAAPQASRS